jgi:hypothetical protein
MRKYMRNIQLVNYNFHYLLKLYFSLYSYLY